MAAEELKTAGAGATGAEELKDREIIANPAEALANSLKGLDKFGGFQLIKGLLKDAENLDPRRKGVRATFLAETAYAAKRKALREEMAIWVKLLGEGSSDPMELIDQCKEASEKAQENLKNNLFAVHEEIRNLETTYRSLNSFFANASQGKVECLSLMNVNKEELVYNDSDDVTAIREELEKYYDRLSLKNNYSLLVVPGYLGGGDAIRMWAKTAARNKVMMVTDFADSQNFEMMKDELEEAALQGQEAELANVIMTANYLLGRKKSEIAGEDEDLFIPGSAALAGRMTNTDEVVIAQGAAGKKYGTLQNVAGARSQLRKSEIAALIDMGVVPMVEEEGRVMAFSNRSLYNGATLGLQEYPIVRVFDWMGKVFQNFFNDEAFTNWNPQIKAELTQALHDFLSDYKGPGKLIENYSLKGVEQDPRTKDIKIKVELKPFFAARNFFIELSGHNGNAGADWSQDIQSNE